MCADKYCTLMRGTCLRSAPAEVIGKIGTDIEEGKCSWPMMQALKVATLQQRAFLEQNYGKNDPVLVEQIKALYRELKVPEMWTAFEEEQYQQIVAEVEKVAVESKLPASVFQSALDLVYKRKK